MKLLLLLWITLPMLILAKKNVNIPDANFKAFLVGQTSINTNGDSEIQYSEAKSFKDTISCKNLKIKNLKGIEAFTSIVFLNCSYNQLTSLDVSQNVSLIKLSCNDNQLTSLDVSQNISLLELSCDDNQLTSLDVSQNVSLIKLHGHNNQLTSLDVSQNVSLIKLYCHNNQLTSLDMSKNVSLITLCCDNNQLTELDIHSNTHLQNLECSKNEIKSLDISKNKYLHQLNCYDNKMDCDKFIANASQEIDNVGKMKQETAEEFKMQYNKIIKVADQKMIEKDYLKAYELYKRASSFMPSDPYPKTMMLELEKLTKKQ